MRSVGSGCCDETAAGQAEKRGNVRMDRHGILGECVTERKLYMALFTCLNCGKGHYEGYDISVKPPITTPCPVCGDVRPARVLPSEFRKAFKARDKHLYGDTQKEPKMTDEQKKIPNPCPFCGRSDIIVAKAADADSKGWAMCTNCQAEGPLSDDPIGAWNTRTASADAEFWEQRAHNLAGEIDAKLEVIESEKRLTEYWKNRAVRLHGACQYAERYTEFPSIDDSYAKRACDDLDKELGVVKAAGEINLTPNEEDAIRYRSGNPAVGTATEINPMRPSPMCEEGGRTK